MDIKDLMKQMHAATNEQEKQGIMNQISSQFASLSDNDKEMVKKEFLSALDGKLKQADDIIRKVDIALELEEISKYVSLSKIASNYFGKSKGWLYQRIKGYTVNGKSASFSELERKKLSAALEDISRMAHETSLKIS